MSFPVFYPVEDDTLPIPFDTFDGGTGASITMTGLAVTDIEIYKDGSVTQRSSDAGYTLLDTDGIDFDGTTGIHGFSIDLSDNTDAGFYTVGPWYWVVVSAITVDGQTVSFVAGMFRILSATRGMSGTALPAAAADAAGGLPISDAGGLDLDTQLANTHEITAARMGALTDWINGGRLDLLLDAIKAVTDALPDSGALTSIAQEATVAALNDLSSAEAQTACNAALVALALDHLVAVAVTGADVADNSIIARMVSKSSPADFDTFIGASDALEAVADAIAALNDLAGSDVLTQVNAALDTAISELGVAAPTATPTIRTGLMLLYMALRNKLIVQTSGTDALEIHNDAGTKICSGAITDSAGDLTRAELA